MASGLQDPYTVCCTQLAPQPLQAPPTKRASAVTRPHACVPSALQFAPHQDAKRNAGPASSAAYCIRRSGLTASATNPLPAPPSFPFPCAWISILTQRSLSRRQDPALAPQISATAHLFRADVLRRLNILRSLCLPSSACSFRTFSSAPCATSNPKAKAES
eukprot:6179967-Pleurochrysis_carterae.AAC.4